MQAKEATYQDLIIKEMTIGQFIPLVELMNDDPMKAQMQMLTTCVYDANGTLLGDAIKQLPASCYMGLWNVVKEVHGMNEKKD